MVTTQLTSAIARIQNARGAVVGAGFLVADKYILTCAHVINAALGKPLFTQEQPDKNIHLNFPWIHSGVNLIAQVVHWVPVQVSESRFSEVGTDIAVLEVERGALQEVQSTRLVRASNLLRHPFQVCGFPEGQSVGVWTDGIISNQQINGRIQIEVIRSTAYKVESGFSGAPIWDEQLDGVVGMMVAIDPRRPNVRAAFMIPATQLIKAWPKLEHYANLPCPYRGLLAFREVDTQFFFGREQIVEQLVTAVQKKSLIALIGPSGSGKSSTIFAGLIPKLKAKQSWLIVSFRPGNHPLHNLVAKLMPFLETEMSETDRMIETNKLLNGLQSQDLSLLDVINRILQKHPTSRLLLVVDQFEELYTLCQNSVIYREFLDQLISLTTQASNINWVLTLRADFLGYALAYRPFADVLQHSDIKLGPMNQDELRAAIVKPAELLGLGSAKFLLQYHLHSKRQQAVLRGTQVT